MRRHCAHCDVTVMIFIINGLRYVPSDEKPLFENTERFVGARHPTQYFQNILHFETSISFNFRIIRTYAYVDPGHYWFINSSKSSDAFIRQ